MADADTEAVDGVEPSILVRLLDTKSNPEQVKIFSGYLVKGDDPILITPQDLAAISGVEIEIVKGSEEGGKTPAQNAPAETPTPDTVVVPAAKPAQEPISPINPPVTSGR